jgi:high-affinity iron transporter
VAGPFVITLREAFEAALILGIVYGYLDRIGARRRFHLVTTGAALGVVASIALGIAVTVFSGPLVDLGPEVIAVIVLATQRLWLVGLIAFTGVFREGAETVLFLWGLASRAASTSEWDSAIGAAGGILVAGALGWAIFRGGQRIDLRRFFDATSIVILLLTAGLVASVLGRLSGMGWLPQSTQVWDTSGLLSDDSFVGSLLNGLVGYRARPSLLEVAGYVAYLTVAGWFVLGRSVRLAPRGAER